MKPSIALLGLGTMGHGMAANLLKAGFPTDRLESHKGQSGVLGVRGGESGRQSRTCRK